MATTRKIKSHGGKRPGAGRPPLPPGEKLVKLTVRLLPAEIARLEHKYGSVQTGVRRLVTAMIVGQNLVDRVTQVLSDT